MFIVCLSSSHMLKLPPFLPSYKGAKSAQQLAFFLPPSVLNGFVSAPLPPHQSCFWPGVIEKDAREQKDSFSLWALAKWRDELRPPFSGYKKLSRRHQATKECTRYNSPKTREGRSEEGIWIGVKALIYLHLSLSLSLCSAIETL